MSSGHKVNIALSPFPALTPGQRLFFEVNGYVVVENTLTLDEIQQTKDAILDLRRTFADSGDPLNFNLNGCHADRCEPHRELRTAGAARPPPPRTACLGGRLSAER